MIVLIFFKYNLHDLEDNIMSVCGAITLDLLFRFFRKPFLSFLLLPTSKIFLFGVRLGQGAGLKSWSPLSSSPTRDVFKVVLW